MACVSILSADHRVKCVVEELEPGTVEYALWRHAGALDAPDGKRVIWSRQGPPALLTGLAWHEALDRLERCVRELTYPRPKPTKGLRR